MGTLRFADLQTRSTELLDLTSLTVEEFQQLVPPFEAAFQAHMAQWRFDGQPRTARRYSTYKTCPLPTPEDRLLCILAYLKTYPPPGGAGAAVRDGPEQGQSMDSRSARGAAGHPAGPGDAPAGPYRSWLAQRMGVTEAEAAGLVVPTVEPSPTVAPSPASSPFLATMGRNGASSAPRTRLSRRAVIVARETCQTVKNVLLINAVLPILFLSDTYAGSTHDKRIADTTPYPLPAGSRLLQELGFLAFTLDHVEDHHADAEAPGPGPHAGTESRESAHRPPTCAHRARQQPRQALPHRPRHLPPAEGGCPRSGDGNLLCLA